MKKNGTLKEHFKMYKAGKVWLFAAVIGLTLGAGAQSVSGLMTLPGFPTAIKASADDGTRPYWFGQNVDYFKHYNETPDKTTVCSYVNKLDTFFTSLGSIHRYESVHDYIDGYSVIFA